MLKELLKKKHSIINDIYTLLKMKQIIKIALGVFILASATGCKDKDGLAPEYMPDMYRSPAIETYVDYGMDPYYVGEAIAEQQRNRPSARKPVEGTIPRGYMPYPYPNTFEGYQLAGEQLKNPLPKTEENVKKGKELFGMFCVHCHGKDGQGQGSLVENGKFPPIPTKFNENLDLPEGKMFHTITYGKGLMGSHASQLTQEERWLLVMYIRNQFMKEPLNNNVNIEADTNAVH